MRQRVLVAALLCAFVAVPVDADGWFPRLSPDGTRTVSGAGQITFTDASGSRDLGVRGWAPIWISDTQFIYNAAEDGLRLFDIGRTATRALDPREFSELAGTLTAKGVFWAGRHPSTNTLVISNGGVVANAGQPAIAPDGYLTFRTGDDKIEPSACRQSALWGDGRGNILGYRRPGPEVVSAFTIPTRVEYRPVCVDTPGGPWVLTMTQTELLLHALESDVGYRLVTGENRNLYSHAMYRTDAIEVVYNDAAGALLRWTQPLSVPRVSLRLAPEPNPPPPPPQEAPNRLDVVQDEFRKQPPAPGDEASWAEFTFRVARRLHAEDPKWGVITKQGGEAQHRGFGIDILAYREPYRQIDILSGAQWPNPSVYWGPIDPNLYRPLNVWAPPPAAVEPPPANCSACLAELHAVRGRLTDAEIARDRSQRREHELERERDELKASIESKDRRIGELEAERDDLKRRLEEVSKPVSCQLVGQQRVFGLRIGGRCEAVR